MNLKFIFDRLEKYKNRKCMLLIFDGLQIKSKFYSKKGYEVIWNDKNILLRICNQEYEINKGDTAVEINDEETRKTQIITEKGNLVMSHFF